MPSRKDYLASQNSCAGDQFYKLKIFRSLIYLYNQILGTKDTRNQIGIVVGVYGSIWRITGGVEYKRTIGLVIEGYRGLKHCWENCLWTCIIETIGVVIAVMV